MPAGFLVRPVATPGAVTRRALAVQKNVIALAGNQLAIDVFKFVDLEGAATDLRRDRLKRVDTGFAVLRDAELAWQVSAWLADQADAGVRNGFFLAPLERPLDAFPRDLGPVARFRPTLFLRTLPFSPLAAKWLSGNNFTFIAHHETV
jgi:hypothetical protein